MESICTVTGMAVETSGLDPKLDSILKLSWVTLQFDRDTLYPRLEIVKDESRYYLKQVGRLQEEEAVKINGLTRERILQEREKQKATYPFFVHKDAKLIKLLILKSKNATFINEFTRDFLVHSAFIYTDTIDLAITIKARFSDMEKIVDSTFLEVLENYRENTKDKTKVKAMIIALSGAKYIHAKHISEIMGIDEIKRYIHVIGYYDPCNSSNSSSSDIDIPEDADPEDIPF